MITPRLYSTARAASAAPAAPAGGGPIYGCRGCGFIKITAAIFAILGCASPLRAANELLGQQVAVPSGQAVYLSEVLQDETPGALWLRFRFIAPAIDRSHGSVDPEEAASDMDHLCQSVALSYLRDHRLKPERISISLSDRQIPFGESDPDATQFFELYSAQTGGQGATCLWEAF